MRALAAALLVAAAAWLAWQAWQPVPAPAPAPAVRLALPQQSNTPAADWYVVTRRLVWKQAVADMGKRLIEAGLIPIEIHNREPVELHTFDDPDSFKSQRAAEKRKAIWRKAGVGEAEVLRRGDEFIVGLGRFYLTAYAEQMQNRLKRLGKPYKYERRNIVIPAFRFGFGPMDEDEAKQTWKKLQDMGLADPVVLPAPRFVEMYGDAIGKGNKPLQGTE
jgi:hypothetical protein